MIEEQYNSLVELAMRDLDNAEYVLNNNYAEYDVEFMRDCFRYLRNNIHEVIWYSAEFKEGGEYGD